MSITKILGNKELSAEDKLKDVATVVAGARETYGNVGAEIEVPTVHTVNGSMPFNLLDEESKVKLLSDEVARVKAEAVEFHTQNPGTNLNRKIEELLATNGMFANIAAGTKFEYI